MLDPQVTPPWPRWSTMLPATSGWMSKAKSLGCTHLGTLTNMKMPLHNMMQSASPLSLGIPLVNLCNTLSEMGFSFLLHCQAAAL